MKFTKTLKAKSNFSPGRNRTLLYQIALLLVVFSSCLSSRLPSGVPDLEALQKLLSPTETTKEEKLQNDLGENAEDHRKYKGFVATCDQDKITISASFRDKFRGRIYALDYVEDPECGSKIRNDSLTNLTFSLPLGQCGVRMTVLNDNLENDLRHTVGLYIQYSAYLQQIIDDKVAVSCVETKKPLPENITSNSVDENQGKRTRQGRRYKDPIIKSGVKANNGPNIGEAWMEIISGKDPSPKTKNEIPVQVGEDLTIVVTTKVTRGYDARVVNCTAHDGSRTISDGSRVQPILDSAGCSIDRGLVPNFRRRRMPVESRNQMTLHFATFPAFKFPERDHIHVRCSVAYCQGPCPQESCDSGRNHYGSWKDKYGRVADILVKTSDIVNAVEVISPELEGLGGSHYERHQSNGHSGVASPTSYTSDSIPPPMSHSMPMARHLQFTDPQPPSASQQQHSSPGYTNGLPSLNSNYHYSPHGAVNGQSTTYANNQIPLQQGTPNANPSAVCVSPGTVILALVILGVVLVISATATLWLALKRSDAKKYDQQKMSSYTSSPTPSPYYRFNHW